MHLCSRTRLAAGLCLVSLLASGTAWAAGDGFVPNTPTTAVYLQCAGPAKEYVVGSFVNDDGGIPTWSTAEPASVTTGAGCGKQDEPVFNGTRPGTPYQLTFSGSYTGNLDTMTVTLYTTDAGPDRAQDAPVTLSVRATVDDVSLFGVTQNTGATGTVVTSPKDRKVTVTPVATGSTGAVRALTFSITGLDLMAPEDDVEHVLMLDVASDGLDNNVWMWGAAEAPSGVVFTPAKAAAASMAADPRATRG